MQCLKTELPGGGKHEGCFAPSMMDRGGGVGEEWEDVGRMEQVGEEGFNQSIMYFEILQDIYTLICHFMILQI